MIQQRYKQLFITAKTFFSPTEEAQISAAIKAAEESSAGEIAVMVVDQSQPLSASLTLGGLLLALILALISEFSYTFWLVSQDHWGPWLSLLKSALEQLTLIPFLLLTTLLALTVRLQAKLFFTWKRLLLRLGGLTTDQLNEGVAQRAFMAFYEKGLHRTRDATGVLIFISLGERQVWILGDQGINQKIGPQFWQEQAQTLIQGLKRGEATSALVQTIQICGQQLAKFFPRAHDDINELSDQVLYEDKK